MDTDLSTSSTQSFESFEWNRLPNELKCHVIRQLGQDSRSALRACSATEKQLVDSVPFKKTSWMTLEYFHDSWQINIRQTVGYNDTPSIEFYKSFDDFQNRLTEIMKNVDYIHHLLVSGIDRQFKLSGNRERIHVERLLIRNCNPMNIISQVEPISLKLFKLMSWLENHNQIYDTAQIISAEEIDVLKSDITDDQLLKLNARLVLFEHTTRLTSTGINNFIKKSIQRPDFERFTIDYCEHFKLDESMIGEIGTITKNTGLRNVVINTGSAMDSFEIKNRSKWVRGRRIQPGKQNGTINSEVRNEY